jgi:peptide/nickel transport system permease protein
MLFLLRKLFQAAMLLAGVALISFILFQYLGDPVANMLPESATEVERMQLRASLGLNDPVFVQFLHYLSRLLHGNFGISYYNQVSVFQLIMERLPATLELVFVAVIISLAVGFPLGVWVAITRNKLLREVQILSLIGVSLPWFLIGIMLIIVFSVWLGWFPAAAVKR